MREKIRSKASNKALSNAGYHRESNSKQKALLIPYHKQMYASLRVDMKRYKLMGGLVSGNDNLVNPSNSEIEHPSNTNMNKTNTNNPKTNHIDHIPVNNVSNTHISFVTTNQLNHKSMVKLEGKKFSVDKATQDKAIQSNTGVFTVGKLRSRACVCVLYIYMRDFYHLVVKRI